MISSPLPVTYQRGQIWMVDFGQPLGHEFGMEHPAVIVSERGINSLADKLGRLIVVPGISTRIENPRTGTLLSSHQEVPNSSANGLVNRTYFMAENVRSLSTQRLRRLTGMMEPILLRRLDDRLCLVMDLFQPGITR